MKNNECTIYIITKNGAKQIFHKEKDGWIQTSTKGIIRYCTAEQVLSHLLPPLAFGHVTLKVEPDRKEEKQKKLKNKFISKVENYIFYRQISVQIPSYRKNY